MPQHWQMAEPHSQPSIWIVIGVVRRVPGITRGNTLLGQAVISLKLNTKCVVFDLFGLFSYSTI